MLLSQGTKIHATCKKNYLKSLGNNVKLASGRHYTTFK
ncbi:unnamed protein product [Brassica oleracea]